MKRIPKVVCTLEFKLEALRRVRTADITYVATGEGWLYLRSINGVSPMSCYETLLNQQSKERQAA